MVFSDDYIFPKGGWNSNESESEAAARECLEEAGITGRIEKNLGVFEFVSPKGIVPAILLLCLYYGLNDATGRSLFVS